MRAIFFLILALFLAIPILAQTFNIRNDPFGQFHGEAAWSVEVNAQGEYLVIASASYQDSVFYSSVVTSLLIDTSGEVIAVDRVIHSNSSFPGWSNGCDELATGGYVVGGNIRILDSLENVLRRPALFFFSEVGEYQSFYELPAIGNGGIGRQAKQTSDGGFVICGETTMNGSTDAFVIKTDLLGQQEWAETYGGDQTDVVVSVDITPTGQFYTGGQKFINSTNKQLWVQALNDSGGVIWEKSWGSESAEPNAHLTTAADGHVLIASGWGVGSGTSIRHYLCKLDENNGEVIWQKQYAEANPECAFYSVQEVQPNNDLIAAGSSWDPDNYYSGVLLRTTSEGDSLWMRHYQYSDSIANGWGLFRDVVPTPDGGFIACGQAFMVPGTYSQDVWVVKVDQHGCLEPGCQLIMGMETHITNMRDVLWVWPNPVQANGLVQVSCQLPEIFMPQGQLKLTITSSDGRLVHEERVDNSSTASTLQLPQLSAGLYHIHLSDASRWISGVKLVVE